MDADHHTVRLRLCLLNRSGDPLEIRRMRNRLLARRLGLNELVSAETKRTGRFNSKSLFDIKQLLRVDLCFLRNLSQRRKLFCRYMQLGLEAQRIDSRSSLHISALVSSSPRLVER